MAVLQPGTVPLFGYPPLNYTPLGFHDDEDEKPIENGAFHPREVGEQRVSHSHQRAWQMWSRLTH